MKFYSTNNINHRVSLRTAVLHGLAPDNGLYMPEVISVFPPAFFSHLHTLSFSEIALAIAKQFVGEDIPESEIKKIVEHTVSFDAPLVEIEQNIFALELFHGPTLAFKDFGARFMAQLVMRYAKEQDKEVTVLAATSGDTGSAVANGFFDVPGIRVVILYPSGKVSALQEKQFASLGKNITAIEVDGTFDDCQRLVKSAFQDDTLKKSHFLTSANSINIARLIPQMFYYFYAWSRLKEKERVVFSVPSGNFGNLTAGLMAKQMGLPIHQFIASTNSNDVVPEFLQTNIFTTRPSVSTISNAMDVGNPSNFARITNLYNHSWTKMKEHISGYSFSDEETGEVMLQVFNRSNYILDPHGAVGLLGLKKYMSENERCTGVFLETAHPAKFKEVVEPILGQALTLPKELEQLISKEKKSIPCSSDYPSLQSLLLSQ
jgi:threonine synthase